MKKKSSRKKPSKRTFIDENLFTPYTKPKMVDVAKEMLCDENLSEEGFLGAQAVLMFNGIL